MFRSCSISVGHGACQFSLTCTFPSIIFSLMLLIAPLLSIVTQLEKLKPTTDVLIELARKLQSDTSDWPSSEAALLQQVTARLVVLVLDSASPLDAACLPRSLREIADTVQLCEELNTVPQLAQVVAKVVKSFQALIPAQKPAACTLFLLPLFGRIEVAQTKSERIQANSIVFAPLYGLMEAVFQYGMTTKDFSPFMVDLMLALPHVGGIGTIRTM